MDEIWLTIPDFPDYEINNKGIVRDSYTGERVKVVRVSQRGSKMVLLTKSGKSYVRSASEMCEEIHGVTPTPTKFIPKHERKKRVSRE